MAADDVLVNWFPVSQQDGGVITTETPPGANSAAQRGAYISEQFALHISFENPDEFSLGNDAFLFSQGGVNAGCLLCIDMTDDIVLPEWPRNSGFAFFPSGALCLSRYVDGVTLDHWISGVPVRADGAVLYAALAASERVTSSDETRVTSTGDTRITDIS